jgi:hypothetical protein
MRVLAFQKNVTARAMFFELFEIDGSRWLWTNISARTQMIMYEHDGKKTNNLFFNLWYRGTILLAEMWVGDVGDDGGFRRVVSVARFF